MMLDEKTIRSIFFYCTEGNKDGLYAEVDILQFAKYIESYLMNEWQKKSPDQQGTKASHEASGATN